MTARHLNFVQKQEYIDRLARGGLRYESAKAMGVTAEDVRISLRDDPDFRTACVDAVLAATEPVETALYKAACASEPWAVTFYLKNRDRERWGEQPKEVKITHELDGRELIASVGVLAEQLARRRQLAESSIDVEAAEADTTHYYENDDAPVYKAIALQKPDKFKHHDLGGEG